MPNQEESKKDTVRISLPSNLSGRPGAPVHPGPPTQKLKPEDPRRDTAVMDNTPDARKETAVMGAVAPVAKKDTSRVQVAAAKPSTPEMPRPTVRLRREEGGTATTGAGPATVSMGAAQAAAAPSAAPAPKAPAAVVAAEGPGGAAIGLAFGAMAFSIAVVVYLAMVYRA